VISGRSRDQQGGEFAHGFTYSAAVTCAVALAVIRAMQAEGIVDGCATIFRLFQKALGRARGSPIIGEARGGMVGAIEIVQDKASRTRYHKDLGAGTRARDICVNNGLVMRAVGDTMIVSPPLVAEHAHIDELLEKAWRCLDLTARSLAAAK
jgi:putrescine aminotransferase